MVFRKGRVWWIVTAQLCVLGMGMGIAGCNSVPGLKLPGKSKIVSTASVDEIPGEQPENFVQTAANRMSNGLMMVFDREAWNERVARMQKKAPVDPFVIASQNKRFDYDFDAVVDYTPVRVQAVNFDEDGGQWHANVVPLNGGVPAWFSDNETEPEDATVVSTRSEVEETVGRSSTRGTVRPTSGSSRSSHAETVPLNRFLKQKEGTSAGITHRDMIIDSSMIAPRRQSSIRPISHEQEVTPAKANVYTPARRPLAAPAWAESDAVPSARANQPVSVAPEIPHPAERVSFSKYRTRMDGGTMFSGSTPESETEGQRWSSEENPFAEIEESPVDTIEIGNERSATPVDATPVPTASTSEVDSASVSEVEPPAPLENMIDLALAKRLADQPDRHPDVSQAGTPLVIGLGLAAVIVGAAMVRSQLA